MCSFLETYLCLVRKLLTIGQLTPVLEKSPPLLGAQLGLECMFQTRMGDSLFPAQTAAAQVGPPARDFAFLVDLNLALRCTHDANELSFWPHLSTLNAGTHRHVFSCHVPSAILAMQTSRCEIDPA